jgi:hypothetical protein
LLRFEVVEMDIDGVICASPIRDNCATGRPRSGPCSCSITGYSTCSRATLLKYLSHQAPTTEHLSPSSNGPNKEQCCCGNPSHRGFLIDRSHRLPCGCGVAHGLALSRFRLYILFILLQSLAWLVGLRLLSVVDHNMRHPKKTHVEGWLSACFRKATHWPVSTAWKPHVVQLMSIALRKAAYKICRPTL